MPTLTPPTDTNKRCLMVVESPSKCKTLKKFLGARFDVMASYGHVRDLPTKRGAVNPEDGFSASYVEIERNARHMREIASKMKNADVLYLATDPDREGEAIAGHVAEILNEKKLLKNKEVYRVAFSEINETAVRHAINNPRHLSDSLIEAQRARRILDHLVGFNLSPLLWKKIHSGLSAGRVQSPALRLIVEREKEIEVFVQREYWTVDALCQHKNDDGITARLIEFNGEKLDKFAIDSEKSAENVRQTITTDSAGVLTVNERSTSTRKLKPPPPFTTSTLLQDAANRLGFDQRRTMRVAQRLYEGIDIGGSPTSLITYMRTDSFNISTQAVERIRKTAVNKYGTKAIPEKARYYRSKSKNSQEAHEAVRPNDPAVLPSQLAGRIDGDELKLYALIWARAMASQMTDAVSEINKILLKAGKNHIFSLSGSRIIFQGHLATNDERRHAHVVRSGGGGKDGEQNTLPDLPEGATLALNEINTEQHFTKPPPRYTVASLVEALDNYGIGRPSTYASIVSILEQRNYMEVQGKNFLPTEMGITVNRFLVEHFERYVDYEFTAKLENQLDSIANGEAKWQVFLESFWRPFDELVKEKTDSVKRQDSIGERVLGPDPKTGRTVSVRIGRYGPYAQIGVKEDEDKPKFASLPPGAKLADFDLAKALQLFVLPRTIGKTAKGEDITAAVGRFGPYIRFGDRFAAMEAEDDPYTVDLERANALISKRIELDRKRTILSFDDETIRVMKSRFGFTIVKGISKKNLPKDYDVEQLTKSSCLELLESEAKTSKKAGAKSTTRAKTGARAKTSTKAVASRAKPAASRAKSAASRTRRPAASAKAG